MLIKDFVPLPTLRIHSTGGSAKQARPHAPESHLYRDCSGAAKTVNKFVPIEITYPGAAHSVFSYDALGRSASIIEQSANLSLVSNFVWAESERCEERDGAGAVTKQLFDMGEQASDLNYFYTLDHLASTREMTDINKAVISTYSYEPFGTVITTGGDKIAASQYAGYFLHGPSRLCLTRFRPYNAELGRWLSPEPNAADDNLYQYVMNDPVSFVDTDGLFAQTPVFPFVRPDPPVIPFLNFPPFVPTVPKKPEHRKPPERNPSRRSSPRRHKPAPPPPPPSADRRCKRKCRAPEPDSPEAKRQKIEDRLHCWQWCEKNCPPLEVIPCLLDCDKYPRDDKKYPNPPPTQSEN